MTKTQIKKLVTARKKLDKCGGNCKHCSCCHLYSAILKNGDGVYAFGCDLLPEEMFSYISDTMVYLHKEAVETVDFELKVGGKENA